MEKTKIRFSSLHNNTSLLVNLMPEISELSAEQNQLSELLSIQTLAEDDENEDSFDRALNELGMSGSEELQDAINKLSSSIERTRAKILGIDVDPDPPEKEEPVYDLVDIPDEELSLDQQKNKKRQRLLKNAAEGRARAQKLRQEKRMKELEDEKKMEEKRQKDFKGWLKDIHKKRLDILEKREKRRQRKSDMAKRRTYASQQRMRIISQLAESKKKKKEDTFGQNDEDWNLYKEIQKDGNDSDSDIEQEKLEEYEAMLTEYDEEFQKENTDQTGGPSPFDLAEYYRLHIGIERIRVPEVVFQPSLIGMSQAGVTDTLDFLLSKFDCEEQDRLVKDVFLTGGPAALPGLKERLEVDLMAMRPFKSSFHIRQAENPSLDAWFGARKFAISGDFDQHCITRSEYQECGGSYLKGTQLTNNPVTIDPARLLKNATD